MMLLREPLIIIIFGASGTGKTTLVEQMHSQGPGRHSVHVKETTREPRQYDDIEIRCIQNFNEDNYDYIYQTYGHKYGLTRFQIEKSIANGQHHFIICNDITTIKALKLDYGERVRVVFHHLENAEEHILQVQESRSITDDALKLRMKKVTILQSEFIQNFELFDTSIEFRVGEDVLTRASKFQDVLGNLMERRSSGVGIADLEAFASELASVTPNSNLFDENYAFIIMPIDDEDHMNIDTHREIVRTCSELGVTAERVTDIQYTGAITPKILGAIAISEFVIADLSNERPNVYYEIGYAHALSKPVILMAKMGTKSHFDLQGDNTIFYRGMTDMSDRLKKAMIGIKPTLGD